jgi:hypothetical protein
MKIAKTIFLAVLLTVGVACGYSKKTTPATPGTMPNISALVPNSANAGSAGMLLTVNGTNFNGNATVSFGSTVLTTTFVTGNQLTATVPAANLATAAQVTVTVTNPGTPGGIYGGGTSPETSNGMTFTIN